MTPNDAWADIIPSGVSGEFIPPQETTHLRVKVYYENEEGLLQSLGVEVRQERKEKRRPYIKQTNKVGDIRSKGMDTTLDRMEQATRLNGNHFGFNVYAIGDRKIRKAILNDAQSTPRPVVAMYSQRIRVQYLTDGDPGKVIELAMEPANFGRNIFGMTWGNQK